MAWMTPTVAPAQRIPWAGGTTTWAVSSAPVVHPPAPMCPVQVAVPVATQQGQDLDDTVLLTDGIHTSVVRLVSGSAIPDQSPREAYPVTQRAVHHSLQAPVGPPSAKVAVQCQPAQVGRLSDAQVQRLQEERRLARRRKTYSPPKSWAPPLVLMPTPSESPPVVTPPVAAALLAAATAEPPRHVWPPQCGSPRPVFLPTTLLEPSRRMGPPGSPMVTPRACTPLPPTHRARSKVVSTEPRYILASPGPIRRLQHSSLQHRVHPPPSAQLQAQLPLPFLQPLSPLSPEPPPEPKRLNSEPCDRSSRSHPQVHIQTLEQQTQAQNVQQQQQEERQKQEALLERIQRFVSQKQQLPQRLQSQPENRPMRLRLGEVVRLGESKAVHSPELKGPPPQRQVRPRGTKAAAVEGPRLRLNWDDPLEGDNKENLPPRTTKSPVDVLKQLTSPLNRRLDEEFKAFAAMIKAADHEGPGGSEPSNTSIMAVASAASSSESPPQVRLRKPEGGTITDGPKEDQRRASTASTRSGRSSFSGGRSSIRSGNVGRTWALELLDEELARRICTAVTPEELRGLELPFDVTCQPSSSESPHLLSWMLWMVHRVALNDPTLLVLDFSGFPLPTPDEEPRIGPKLFIALGRNTHLKELRLRFSNVFGDAQARSLAASLAQNQTLRLLDIGANHLKGWDMEAIFEALTTNQSLEELSCGRQLEGEAAGSDAYKVLASALQQNRSLKKLGLELSHPHWRDQICRSLVRNREVARRLRYEQQRLVPC